MTIAWPAVYGAIALGIAALAGRPGELRLGAWARWLPALAVIGVAAAAHFGHYFPDRAGRLDLWHDEFLQLDVIRLALYGVLGSLAMWAPPAEGGIVGSAALTGFLVGGLPASLTWAPQAKDRDEAMRATGAAWLASLASPFGGAAQLFVSPLDFGARAFVPVAIAAGIAIVIARRDPAPARLTPAGWFVALGMLLARVAARRYGLGLAIVGVLAAGLFTRKPLPRHMEVPAERGALAVLAVVGAHIAGTVAHASKIVDDLDPSPLAAYFAGVAASMLGDPGALIMTLSRMAQLRPGLSGLMLPAALGLAVGPLFPALLMQRLRRTPPA